MTLIQLLQSGAVLRYKPAGGFYVVKGGQGHSNQRRRGQEGRECPPGAAGWHCRPRRLCFQAQHKGYPCRASRAP